MQSLIKRLLLVASLSVSICSFGQNYTQDWRFGFCGNLWPQLEYDKNYELAETHVLSNGKILTIGNGFTDSGRNYLVLVQYLQNGVVDSFGFGINGSVTVQHNFQSFVFGSMVEPDGKIVVVGFENDSTTNEGRIPAIYRFNADGSIDLDFNATGFSALQFEESSSGHLENLMRWDAAHLMAAGISFKVDGSGSDGIGVVKLKNSGLLDSSFGNLSSSPGRSLVETDSADDVHIFSQSNTVVVPFISSNGIFDTIMAARLLENGLVDSSFGSNGILNTGIRSENLAAIQHPNGNLLLGGTLNEDGQLKKMQLLKYLDEFVPDPAFGNNGQLVLPTIGAADADNVLNAIMQLADGRILVLGYYKRTGMFSIKPIILRLLSNGEPDTTFNGTGNMELGLELASGWNNIDTTDSTDILITHEGFSMVKYVSDTVEFDVTVAGFDYSVEKLKVYFENTSDHANLFLWDLGDNTYTETVNPSHEYSLPGSYPVYLEAYSNCGFDDTTRNIEIKGVYKISPTVAPDNGFVACKIYGYGFSDASQVTIKKNGSELSADAVFFDTATHSLQANFNFSDAPVGMYDLMVTTGGRTDTLPQSLEIEGIEIGEPWIQVTGPHSFKNYVLVGRYASFKLEYGVTGNATQYLMPIALVIQGTGLLPEIVTQRANMEDTTGLPDSLKPHSNGFYQFYDEVNQDSVWVMYLNDVIVHPNETNIIDFSIIARNLDSFSIRTYIGKSLFTPDQLDSLYGSRVQEEICNDCMKCILDVAGYLPGPFGCAAGIIGLTCSVSEFEITPETSIGDVLDLGLDFASTTISCGTMTGGTFGELLEAFTKSIFGFALEQQGNLGSVTDCASAISGVAEGDCDAGGDEDGGKYDPLGSWDPNSKVGPGTGSQLNYISKNENLAYTIYFENLATATAPALEVEIVDTLDKTVMDLSSFQFNRISIAGVDYPNFVTRDNFITDIPMAGKGITVRVNGKIDTATGVVTWKFMSLDTLTMALVTDPFQGFLPPNIDSVIGTGAVGFSVAQKPTNAHLTIISNRARIVFDLNEPIYTPEWINIVDTVKPQSLVSNSFRILSDSTFSFKWSGSDEHSGIRNYRIAVSVNDSSYNFLASFGKGSDSTVIKGSMGSIYKFISVARDSADNIEDPPADPLANPDAVFSFNLLPVKLLSFAVVKEDQSARLKWSTSSEINSSFFAIEHSADGFGYAEIGKVNAAGTSMTFQNYSFIHSLPVNGNNYYRLRMVDKDGRFEYSSVRLVKFNVPDVLAINPNPATNEASITVSEIGGTIRIISATGSVVHEVFMISNRETIDLSGLAQGVYFVIYTTRTNKMVREKLVVAR